MAGTIVNPYFVFWTNNSITSPDGNVTLYLFDGGNFALYYNPTGDLIGNVNFGLGYNVGSGDFFGQGWNFYRFGSYIYQWYIGDTVTKFGVFDDGFVKFLDADDNTVYQFGTPVSATPITNVNQIAEIAVVREISEAANVSQLAFVQVEVQYELVPIYVPISCGQFLQTMPYYVGRFEQ